MLATAAASSLPFFFFFYRIIFTQNDSSELVIDPSTLTEQHQLTQSAHIILKTGLIYIQV